MARTRGDPTETDRLRAALATKKPVSRRRRSANRPRLQRLRRLLLRELGAGDRTAGLYTLPLSA
jgi:hypothetical protein